MPENTPGSGPVTLTDVQFRQLADTVTTELAGYLGVGAAADLGPDLPVAVTVSDGLPPEGEPEPPDPPSPHGPGEEEEATPSPYTAEGGGVPEPAAEATA
ncbi:hypothetical protein PV341_34810 [Streptomyces sp. PA03-1a]|nr:hypothetical protein [Streptomyces sp. PA03-1a]MDX2814978.1 hypothetical protein [Streptomyces sp. PA03-5A]